MKRVSDEKAEEEDPAFLMALVEAEQDYLLKRGRIQETKRGRIWVAKYVPGKPLPDPPVSGCRNLLIHISTSDFAGALSPFVLRDEHGQLLENVWQFSKLYNRVYAQRQLLYKKNPSNSPMLWEHPAETHVDLDTNEPTAAYWAWRHKGMQNKFAVRYPNGYNGRRECVCAIWEGKRLDYIEARKAIYLGEYKRLAPKTHVFQQLVHMVHKEGKDIQLIEVDGPDPTLSYWPYEKRGTMEMDEKKLDFLLNDKNKPFGHGFVLALLLLSRSS